MGATAQSPNRGTEATLKPRLLLADDEAELLQGYARLLAVAGYQVDTAKDGKAAIELLKKNEFNAVISDISMPGMNGLELLRAVREYDLDVPVILMTGGPAVETAVTAMEHGALRYLIKPVEPNSLIDIVGQAVLLHRMAKAKREALTFLGSEDRQVGDRAGADARFTSALKSLWMAFQPIVSWNSKKIYGFEALVRTDEPSLPHPGALFDAAERLGRLQELSRTIRSKVAASISQAPPGANIFVNLHTRDLLDEELFAPSSPLSAYAPQLVFEITERTALDEVQDVPTRVAALRDLGYRIAIDDLGAGYAGLTTFAQLEPEVVKLDMSLVRGVHTTPTKRKLIQTMATLCQELGMLVIAEGIETVAERDILEQLGCDLMQGFYFAKPGRGFPPVNW
jgi:EAL domain-containing protein (putative c-di-GMP-specific phosphodiesterase class I)